MNMVHTRATPRCLQWCLGKGTHQSQSPCTVRLNGTSHTSDHGGTCRAKRAIQKPADYDGLNIFCSAMHISNSRPER